MHQNDPFQPFDAEADFADEDASHLTSEFWRGDRHWMSKSKPNGQRRQTSQVDEPVTGTVRAIRAGFAAFRPRTVEGAGRSDRDRTREHGIVRPGTQSSSDSPKRAAGDAVPLATREVSIAELAGEWLDEPMPHRSTRGPQRNTPGPRPIRDEMADARRTTRLPVIAPKPQENLQQDDGFADGGHGNIFDNSGYSNAYDQHEYDDAYDEHEYDDHEVALTPVAALSSRLGLGAVDPLLARVGAMVLVALMLVPLALAMRSGNENPSVGALVPPPSELATATAPSGSSGASPSSPAELTVNALADTAPADTALADTAPALESAASSTQALDQTMSLATANAGSAGSEAALPSNDAVATTVLARNASDDGESLTEAAVAEEQAQRIPCGDSYTIVRNDSWYRIAAAAEVSMKDLLDVNMATTQTVLLVGADICLPQGASIAAPTTPSTSPPTTTVSPPTTSAAPTTTAAPPTTAAAIPNVTTDQVQQLIRDIFPDDQEAKALDVAFRESRYIATADNGHCCVGVFQLHWTAHRSWLDDFGIYTRDDLKNAEKNIRAALSLYQSSGWGPWGG